MDGRACDKDVGWKGLKTFCAWRAWEYHATPITWQLQIPLGCWDWKASEDQSTTFSNNPDGPCRHASCEQMSQWIHTSFNEIKLSERMIAYNSWRHHQFSYFPNEPARAAVPPPIVPAPPDSDRDDTDNSNVDPGSTSDSESFPPPIVPAPSAVLAASLPPGRRDPGWDDTDDSN